MSAELRALDLEQARAALAALWADTLSPAERDTDVMQRFGPERMIRCGQTVTLVRLPKGVNGFDSVRRSR